ncbi:MAG: hypothetical protein M3010_02350 [Candidatus Dormibacteraeota bacterium]|nr:hypothetical protein [Candidatus Dormibacteraeota bacterium]
MAEQTETTIDHDAIRAWALARGGRPAVIDGATDADNAPVLRVAFGDQEAGLREITWEEFFDVFDAGRLALIHGGDTDPGHTHKLVSRAQAEQENG